MPESYALVTETFHCKPAEVLFVSSNAWDALGATWAGFMTVWINRQALPYETLGPNRISPEPRWRLSSTVSSSLNASNALALRFTALHHFLTHPR